MDIGRSLTFVTEDEAWINKLGIGAVISLVPLLNLALTGYMVEVIRNTANEDPRPLPDWSDLGGQFMRGLIMTLGLLIYSLPAILIGCLAFTTILGPAIFAESEAVEELAAASGGVIVLSVCCILIYALVLSFFIPAAIINFARRERFTSMFEIGKIFAIITHNPADYFIALIVSLGVGLAVGLLTGLVGTVASLIPCVGWVASMVLGALATVWTGLVSAHLFGQAARSLASGVPFGAQE